MRRLGAVLTATLVLAGLIGSPAGAVPVAAAAAVPKVVLIVGPSGAATERYRAEARAAADLARRYTPDVTELYSPDATWPAVRKALQGASVVVYMGHGNGWPSRYRDHLYPPTQNGFGLNPQAGGGDGTHQYFGEARIADSIRLADDAVVLLHHLCYASGNSEPGIAEGTLEQARQRVDNFAAGFIRAGASAVVAEAHANPNHMLRAVLAGGRSIERAWRAAPSRNGNAFAFESERSRGFVAQMDPERESSGFTRSIVLREGLAPADVRRAARGSAAPVTIDADALAPSLVAAGFQAQAPTLTGTLAVASAVTYDLPYDVKRASAMPGAMMASARWDPLDPPAAGGDGPPDLGLVVPERLGDVVEPVAVTLADGALSVGLATPTAPGRYRLAVTLHDADGVAFDAASQALVTGLLVRVSGDLDARIVVPERVDLTAGTSTGIRVWVANTGRVPWGHPEITDAPDPEGFVPAAAATLVARWVALGLTTGEGVAASVGLPAGFQAGAVVGATLPLTVPSTPGEYLLLLDVLTPEHGSLIAAGVEPTLLRVMVAQPPAVPAGGAQQ